MTSLAGCDNGTNGNPTPTIYGCTFSEKTTTRTDSDGNKSTQYLLSMSYDNALAAVTRSLGSPVGDQNSFFWTGSSLATSSPPWVILKFTEFHFSEGSISTTNQVRLVKNEGGLSGKRWVWQR